MQNRFQMAVAVVITAGVFACTPARRSPVGFRLPEGDIASGKAAFVKLECHACHPVRGVEDLPPPSIDPPVVLGGSVNEVRTDGYLVTSIIHPSHDAKIPSEGASGMPDPRDKMTVQQLVDIVAFLQSKYKFVPPSPQPGPSG